MKKMYKKVTAFILAIAMIVAYIQIKAYAFDNNVSEITRNQVMSDATIQSGLGAAKNYGLFSLDAKSYNDLECSVAAKYADLGADYNFSGNNTKVYKNQLTVSKSFMINNQPQANKNVTLRLYRMDSSQSVLIDEMTQTTNSNGKATFVFDGMKDSSSNKVSCDAKEDFNFDYKKLKKNIIKIKKVDNEVINKVSYKKYTVSMKKSDAYNLIYDKDVMDEKNLSGTVDVQILVDKSTNFIYEIDYVIDNLNSDSNNKIKYSVQINNFDFNNNNEINLPF